MQQFPFTVTELQKALELVMPADEAAQLVKSWGSPEQGFAVPIGHGVSYDTVILLSLVSDELRERVDTYLREIGWDPDDPELRSRRITIESELRQDGRLPKR
jgi:hypothetical protein